MAVKKAKKTKKTRKTKRAQRTPSKKITALMIGGKLFKAGKGYHFQKSGTGIALMRRGSTQVDFNCECSETGGCRVEINGQTATCLENGCTGSCGWVVKVPGILGFPALRVLA